MQSVELRPALLPHFDPNQWESLRMEIVLPPGHTLS